MTHPMLPVAIALALLVAGCLHSGDAAPDCAVARAEPLYFGDTEPAQLELSPAQRAAIGLVESGSGDAACTGVLIARGHVLTGAHCQIGEALSFLPSLGDATAVDATAAVAHPTLDALLMQLEPDPQLDALAPIPLWSGPFDDLLGMEATLAGLGLTETGESGELRFLDEEVVDLSDDEIVVDGMGRSGACVGDSGGPLLVATDDGRPRVAGVLSRGSHDCLGIDVYVRADRLANWVQQQIPTHSATEQAIAATSSP